MVTTDNTASDVRTDTDYRSRANEAWLKKIGRVSRIHRKKPRGKPMPAHTARADAGRSAVRVRVEYVFARQKDQRWLFIRTIGIARAEDHPSHPRLQNRPPNFPRMQNSHGTVACGEGAFREETSGYAA